MPKGILLHGPPGTGKTLLAKALAKQGGYWFLDITASSIQSKWYGEANRTVAAVFSLARKLERCIIFIDEVDGLLNRRHASGESEGSLQVKSEFLKLWDGMDSNRNKRVLVMGATNRISALDDAAKRRFRLRREVPLPDADGRRAILSGYLHQFARAIPGGQAVAQELLEGPLDGFVELSSGFSGSDLQNVCAEALKNALYERLESSRAAEPGGLGGPSPSLEDVRLTEAHLTRALQVMLAQRAAEGVEQRPKRQAK